jgi:RNA polymerase sigma-70 factor (ECF subfamily)
MQARLGNRPGAEDLISEVFRTALGPLRLGPSKGEERACLLVTAKSVLAYWSSRLRLLVTSIDPEADSCHLAEPSGGEPPSVAPHRVAEILVALPSRYRRTLELGLLEAYSIKEAAQVIGVSLSNAIVLLYRAHRIASPPPSHLSASHEYPTSDRPR